MKKLLLVIITVLMIGAARAQTTPNLNLNIPAHNAANWDVLLNANFSQLDLYLSSGKSIPSLIISGNLSVGGTCTGCGSGSTPGGDLSGNATSQEVIGILNNALPSLSVGALTWTGSAWAFSSGSVTGTGAATQVTVWSGSTVLTSYSGFTTDSSGDVTVLTLATNGSGAGRVQLAGGLYATLNTSNPCNSTNKGMISVVTDSTTATWGATIAGSSSHYVLAFCDGSNWTVAGS